MKEAKKVGVTWPLWLAYKRTYNLFYLVQVIEDGLERMNVMTVEVEKFNHLLVTGEGCAWRHCLAQSAHFGFPVHAE
jgi:hypothetical protein